MATEHTVFGPESQPAKLYDKLAEDARKAAAPRPPRPPGKIITHDAQIIKRAAPVGKKP